MLLTKWNTVSEVSAQLRFSEITEVQIFGLHTLGVCCFVCTTWSEFKMADERFGGDLHTKSYRILQCPKLLSSTVCAGGFHNQFSIEFNHLINLLYAK